MSIVDKSFDSTGASFQVVVWGQEIAGRQHDWTGLSMLPRALINASWLPPHIRQPLGKPRHKYECNLIYPEDYPRYHQNAKK